ncbi:MAG: SDR family NAD(P)-dependent oxidoreductase [Alphaproteobacteria bacterium]|jgi:3-oxoacyl-[acyl-carrier protein] reductase|nr:SDR family NAD(P)-dependent oxidoreductase [Alphaproteobacteria bacterium]
MNQIDLSGRQAVVTGGATGIGRAITQRFLASGARVRIWDIDQAGIEAALAEEGAGDRLAGARVDVTDGAQVAEAAAEAGAVDILVNNAGIAGPTKKTWEYTDADWQSVMDLNLTAVFNCCRACVPGMMAAGWGRIVSIASIAGKEGNPNACAYSATKAGVIGLTKSLAKELAESGVLVNCVTPAAIRTAIFDQISQEHVDYMLSKIPMARLGKVEEAAALVAWLASDDCSFSTGAVFDLSGGRATY